MAQHPMPDHDPIPSARPARPPRPARRGRRLALVALLILGAAGLATEAAARWWLGLGTPLLYVRDPDTEYLNRPNQDFHRFGCHVVINQYGQRNSAVAPTKSDARDFRVLLLGDSVAFGGTQLDQADTIGTRLEALLQAQLQRPVRVLTIAAGSWGPANVVGYLRKFGTFDADAALWLFPTDDWFDAMGTGTHIGADPSFPTHAPWSATSELVSRYLWPRLARLLARPAPPPLVSPGTTAGDFQGDALTQLADLCRTANLPLTFVLWPNEAGLQGQFDHDARRRFLDAGEQAGARFLDLTPLVQAAASTPALYRDQVHPSAAGAAWIAERLAPAVAPPTSP